MNSYAIHLEASPDGGLTATIDDMPGCLAEGDDLCETLRNLAAAAAIWCDDLVEMATRTTADRITIYTAREGAGDSRETIDCWTERTLTQLGLWLIDAAAMAAAQR